MGRLCNVFTFGSKSGVQPKRSERRSTRQGSSVRRKSRQAPRRGMTDEHIVASLIYGMDRDHYREGESATARAEGSLSCSG